MAALLLVIALGEVAVRIAKWRDETAARETAAAWRAAHPEAADLEEIRGVMALARKNVRGIFKGAFVRTNAHGFRGPNRPARAPDDVVRIVVAGDSFTFGSGVDEEDVYASRLAARLDAARPGEAHEVVNAGMAGAHIDGVMDRLEVAIEAYQPDLYVYGFTMNDIEGPPYRVLEEGERDRGWLRLAEQQPLLLFKYLAWQYVTMGGQLLPSEQAYPRELRLNYFENPAAWERFTQGLDRFAALAAQQGVCAHVFIHTHLTHLSGEHPFEAVYERVAEAARARGLSVTRSLDVFTGREPRSLWVGDLDSHPNGDGHSLLAESLATGLDALPETCWERAAAMPRDEAG